MTIIILSGKTGQEIGIPGIPRAKVKCRLMQYLNLQKKNDLPVPEILNWFYD